MALPLPSVVSDVGPGGAFLTAVNAGNALKNNVYGTRIKEQEAKYAPYQAYGNAFLTNQQAQWLPYQYQMQALSNPLLWMSAQSNPELQKQLSQMMSNPMQGGGGVSNIPMPSNTSNGLLGMILSKMGFGNSSNPNAVSQGSSMGGAPKNSMIPMPGQDQGVGTTNPSGPSPAPTQSPAPTNQVTHPLVPSSDSPIAGAAAKMTYDYTKSPTAPGDLIPDPNHPGQLISVADANARSAAQQAIQGITNLKPILNDISSGASKWLSPGMSGKLKAAQYISSLGQNVGNLGGITPQLMKATGLTTKDLSDYAEWQANQGKAVETLMKARQWPQDAVALQKVSQIIQPIPGEGKEYGDRVARELAQLEQQLLPNYQETLGSGFTLPKGKKSNSTASTGQPSSSNNAAPSDEDINYTAKKYNMTPAQVKQYLGIK